MSSLVTSVDFKLSLMDRVTRNLSAEPSAAMTENNNVAACVVASQDAAGDALQDSSMQELCEDNHVSVCLDTALIGTPPDDRSSSRQQAVTECGDMDITAPRSSDDPQQLLPRLTIDSLHLPFDAPVEPPIEERITIDDFDLPFDNDKGDARISEAVVEKRESKPRISVEDLHLPFDEPTTVTASQVPSHRKRQKKNRRRTADFEIASTKLSISPDIQLPDAPPIGRRSSRLRRKSTELYRNQLQAPVLQAPVLHAPVSQAPVSHAPVLQAPVLQAPVSHAPVSHASAVEVLHSAPESSGVTQREEEEVVAAAAAVVDCVIPETAADEITCAPDMLQALQDVHVSHHQQQQAMEAEEEAENIAPLENCAEMAPMQVDDASQAKKKPRTKRKCTLPSPEERRTPPKKRRSSPKKPPAPCIEDIYRNRLWRTEMPTEKPWETIYEEPRLKAKNSYQSTKAQKRRLDPDEFYTQTKLKRRRNKAIKGGYKPPSKKRLQKAEKLLLEKLSQFDQELLETDESSMGSYIDAQSSSDPFGDNLKDLQISPSKTPCVVVDDLFTMDSDAT